MAEQLIFHSIDFFSFGFEAGKAWKDQFQERYADTYLEHIASEMQARNYHFRGACFPPQLINAWNQGFLEGVKRKEQ